MRQSARVILCLVAVLLLQGVARVAHLHHDHGPAGHAVAASLLGADGADANPSAAGIGHDHACSGLPGEAPHGSSENSDRNHETRNHPEPAPEPTPDPHECDLCHSLASARAEAVSLTAPAIPLLATRGVLMTPADRTIESQRFVLSRSARGPPAA